MLKKMNSSVRLSLLLVIFFASFVLSSVNEYAEGADYISVSTLTGKWSIHNGSGTAQGWGEKYTLKLKGGGGNVIFNNASGGESSGTIVIDGGYAWDVYENGHKIGTEILPTNGPEKYDFERTGDNKFKIISPYGREMDVTLSSDSKGSVHEYGTYDGYDVDATYSISKGGGEGGSGGGGCDTGISFGLIIALGASAVLRRAKRKA